MQSNARRTATAPPIGDCGERLARLDEQPLPGRHFRRLQHRVLVVGLDLQDLLVERAGLREKSLCVQMIGDANELLDGLVDPAAAHVQIAEDIRCVPVARLILDDAHVLRNGLIELPLAEKLLGVAQRRGAIDGHGMD